jgi:glycosyltransferase involved in cell wall biosynthesis
LDNFPTLERANLLSCDELLVCSKWAQSVVENSTGQPSTVVPLGVDSSIFYPEEPTNEISSQEKPFTFFFPGKFEYRKGFDIVMDLFDKAFPSENVEVIFLPQNMCIKDNQDWINSLMRSNLAKKNRVKIIGRVDSPQQVSDIIRYSDAVVSFSRAEGWNLPLLEALSCGRQVIATNYSGHTEFLSSTNSLLLDVNGREPAIDGVFFNGSGNWLSYSDSDLDNFISSLRQTFQKGRRYNGAGVETAKQFSWENSARALISVL